MQSLFYIIYAPESHYSTTHNTLHYARMYSLEWRGNLRNVLRLLVVPICYHMQQGDKGERGDDL